MSNSQLFNNNEIIDIDLSVTAKKKFRINHDDSKILELNVADMNIVTRLGEALPKLEALKAKTSGIEIGDELTDEDIANISARLKEVDSEMRNLVDFIFDSNVSEVVADDGSMYDVFNGEIRCEHIIGTLIKLYEGNMEKEYKKLVAQTSKHTSKYIK